MLQRQVNDKGKVKIRVRVRVQTRGRAKEPPNAGLQTQVRAALFSLQKS
jgi:hypothetical protein